MFLVTITTGIGTEGDAVAAKVAGDLQLELYDDARLQKEAIALGIKAEEWEKINERIPSFFDRIRNYEPELYKDIIEEVLYSIASNCNGLIVGHGSQVLLRDFDSALHVRIFASEETRIKNITKVHGMSREAATKMIHKSDHERSGFLRFAYKLDWNDPALYDLTINMDKMHVSSAVNLIEEVTRSQEIQACSEAAIETMQRFALLKTVHSTLLKNEINASRLNIDVADEGTVTITGWLADIDQKNRVNKIVGAIPGVEKFKSEIILVATYE